MDLDLTAARKHAEYAAREVEPDLRAAFGVTGAQSFKSERATDVVTRFDVETDERLARLLGEFDPRIGYLGEERGSSGSSETYWVVDPIDGTGHFLRGLPFCTTMISLISAGEVLVTAICHFVTGRLYSAARGQGATCNGEPISVSSRGLRDGYVGGEIDTRHDANLPLLRKLDEQTTRIGMVNCGWEFSMVAEGRLEGRIMKDPYGKLWDYAPGALLVCEAGGEVANLGGRGYDVTNFDFAVGTPAMMAELMDAPDAVFPR